MDYVQLHYIEMSDQSRSRIHISTSFIKIAVFKFHARFQTF